MKAAVTKARGTMRIADGDEFAEAVALVARRGDALAGLLTHEFPLEETPVAIDYAMRHPAEVMKAIIRLDGP